MQCTTMQSIRIVPYHCAEDNKPSFVFTRIIYLEHGLLRVSSFLQDATGGAEKHCFSVLYRNCSE